MRVSAVPRHGLGAYLGDMRGRVVKIHGHSSAINNILRRNLHSDRKWIVSLANLKSFDNNLDEIFSGWNCLLRVLLPSFCKTKEESKTRGCRLPIHPSLYLSSSSNFAAAIWRKFSENSPSWLRAGQVRNKRGWKSREFCDHSNVCENECSSVPINNSNLRAISAACGFEHFDRWFPIAKEEGRLLSLLPELSEQRDYCESGDSSAHDSPEGAYPTLEVARTDGTELPFGRREYLRTKPKQEDHYSEEYRRENRNTKSFIAHGAFSLVARTRGHDSIFQGNPIGCGGAV